MVSRKKKVAAAVGGMLGLGGVALAAVLLTSTVVGNATVDEVRGSSNSVAVVADSNDGSALKCDVSVTPDAKTITVNPKLTKVIDGENASGRPVPGGSCTIALDVTNTGTSPIRVAEADLTAPAGWVVSDPSGLNLPIAPDATQRVSVKLTANQDAVPGAMGGKLVYTDAA